jgi:ubiquinone/menaquinone biosynthesis C-methylase UbiE
MNGDGRPVHKHFDRHSSRQIEASHLHRTGWRGWISITKLAKEPSIVRANSYSCILDRRCWWLHAAASSRNIAVGYETKTGDRLYSWKEYWANLAASYGCADAQGFSAVLHPDTPVWFNATIDRLQERAWRKGIQLCQIKDDAKVLDVGCGTGRWLRRYSERGLHPVGVDATEGMLQRAAAGGLKCPLVVGLAQSLPFADGAFDLVSAVTVIQHIPPVDQGDALKEMARVLQPGGHMLLLELIRGQGPHIFSRCPSDWIEQASSAGLSLVGWRGQEYLVLDRVFVQIVQAVRNFARNNAGSSLPVRAQVGKAKAVSTARLAYWAIRRSTCTLSEWLEPIVQNVCPGEWATHALFVFKK